jgi:hypothetical protein
MFWNFTNLESCSNFSLSKLITSFQNKHCEANVQVANFKYKYFFAKKLWMWKWDGRKSNEWKIRIKKNRKVLAQFFLSAPLYFLSLFASMVNLRISISFFLSLIRFRHDARYTQTQFIYRYSWIINFSFLYFFFA